MEELFKKLTQEEKIHLAQLEEMYEDVYLKDNQRMERSSIFYDARDRQIV